MSRLLQRLRTAWDIFKRFGLLAFLEALRERAAPPRSQGAPTAVSMLGLSNVASVPNVSVIIPTRNGGAHLVRLVDSLLGQESCGVEVVLVDSESSDGSLDPLRGNPRVQVLTISPEQFSHSFSRNRGVAAARHALIFLTVQDASFPYLRWLSRLCALREAAGLDALSAAESPHEDADPFARFSIEAFSGHHAAGTVVYHRPRRGRQNWLAAASLNNVACLYRREVLSPGFEGDFGEDFRMGLRLVREGFRVGFTDEIRVQHSHNRPAGYWLKRMYASSRLQRELGLGDRQVFRGADSGDILCRTAVVVWRTWLRDQGASTRSEAEAGLFEEMPFLFSARVLNEDSRTDDVVARGLILSIRHLEQWLDDHRVVDPAVRHEAVWKHLMSRLGWLLGSVRSAPWQDLLARGV